VFDEPAGQRRYLSVVYILVVHSIWHSYAACDTSHSAFGFRGTTGVSSDWFLRESHLVRRQTMKFRFETSPKRSELSALMPVIALLSAATLAKLGVAAQFFHFTH